LRLLREAGADTDEARPDGATTGCGIDISGLPFVIQMIIPDDIENCVHRIGRCGRAERMGLAIALDSCWCLLLRGLCPQVWGCEAAAER
jgi:hypothetical protein